MQQLQRFVVVPIRSGQFKIFPEALNKHMFSKDCCLLILTIIINCKFQNVLIWQIIHFFDMMQKLMLKILF